jgi:MFS family permease
MFNVVILGLVSLLTDASSEMVYPLLPIYLSRIGAGPAIIGLIEGIAESLASLLKVFSGYFADKFQRRKPLAVAGYATSPLGKLLLYISVSWPLVLARRNVDRFGTGWPVCAGGRKCATVAFPSTPAGRALLAAVEITRSRAADASLAGSPGGG